MLGITVVQDDRSSAEVQALIGEHLAGMHDHSPPGHLNALALEGLRAPSVTFWTAAMTRRHWTSPGDDIRSTSPRV